MEVNFVNINDLIQTFRGVTVTVITTSAAFPLAIGEVIDGSIPNNVLAIRLTAAYDSIAAGTVVYFNPNQIVAIG